MSPQVIDFLTPKGIGDLVGIIGLIVAVIGFCFAINEAKKAVTAAQAAKKAAEEARASITLFETIVDFSAGIANLKEIKRLQRLPDAQHLLPDRYQATRELLIVLRNSKADLNDVQKTVIQNAIVNLADIEHLLEKSLAAKSPFKSVKHNAILSADIDGLLGVLTQLKQPED